jgi:hypothetical protein
MSKPARRILTINAGFSSLRFAIEGCGTLRLCTGGAFDRLATASNGSSSQTR